MSVNFTADLENSIERLCRQGAFLTVKHGEIVNTMTISWGNIGYEWNKPMFTALVRKSRYTHELLENEGEFTVSIPLNNEFRSELAFCGSKSGRHIDKFKESGLILKEGDQIATPHIDKCGIVYECKIVYRQEMNPENLSKEIIDRSYPDNDLHTIYFGEIVNVITD